MITIQNNAIYKVTLYVYNAGDYGCQILASTNTL
jgi:hypothetical protein